MAFCVNNPKSKTGFWPKSCGEVKNGKSCKKPGGACSGKPSYGILRYIGQALPISVFWRRDGGEMKYSKPLKISGKVLKVDDVERLSSIVESEFSKSNLPSKKVKKGEIDPCVISVMLPASKKYILRGDDEMQYESDDKDEVFTKHGPLATSRIIAVEMSFEDRNEDKGISIKLNHGSEVSETGNRIVVSSNDETWTDGIYKKAETILGECKDQTVFTWKYRLGLFFLISAIMGLILSEAVVIFSHFIWNAAIDVQSFAVMFAFSFLFISASISPVLVGRIERMYPNVELVTGPDHLRPEAIGRKRLDKWIELVIVPLVISIVMFLIGSFIH